MQYMTVYELTREPFPWWIPAWLVTLAVIGAVILLLTRDLGPITKIVRIGVALFACFCMVLAYLNLRGRRQLVDAYREGRYAVIEGRVEQHSFSGKTECFHVRAMGFCRGTVQSAWPGAIVHDGEPVRIVYSRAPKADAYPVILRIEAGRDAR